MRNKTTKILKWTTIGIAAIVVIVATAGFFAEPRWQVRQTIIVNAPSDRIFPYLNNPRQWPEWIAWNTKTMPNMTTSYEGPETGVGATQLWRARGSNGVMKIIESVDGHRVAYRLLMNGGDTVMYGELGLAPELDGPGTIVSWSSWGDSGGNPFRQLMMLIYKPKIAKDFDEGLKRLKAKLEQGD